MIEGRLDRLRVYARFAPRRYAVALAAATNDTTRRTPAPRDLPFFGQDHPAGTRGTRLERLSELGIFRFYERVLDLDAGLGGPARWLARRRGCSVVSFGRTVEHVAASRLLVRRAHLDGAVRVGVAAFDRLPVASGSFTHAWSVEALCGESEKAPVLAELFRAVRPGGHVALQEWTAGSVPDVADGTETQALVGALRAAGFCDVRCEPADTLADAETAIGEIVRERLAELLGEPSAGEVSAFEAARREIAAHELAVAERRLALVHVFARKPA
jgi:SAM-dependent methyltransferase